MKIPFTNIRIFEKRSGLSSPERWLIDALGGYDSRAGVKVNLETSLKVIAVYSCVKLLSETMASLPLVMYKKVERGKKKADNHPLYSILHDIPNPEQTSFEFWQMMMVNMLLTKGGFAEIVRDGGGFITELWPIPSNRVYVRRNLQTKEIFYQVIDYQGAMHTLYPENMLHIKGMSFDGFNCFEPVELFREAVGLGIAAESYGSYFFSNGTNTGGIVEYEAGKVLSKDAKDYFRKTFNEAYTGLGNSNRLLFLENGAKFQKVSTPPDTSQFLETRKFQIVEIARFFNVPPHKIMDLERATFSNIEEQNISFVVDTIRPWCVKIEQSIFKDLLIPSERKRYFTQFSVDAILRGNLESRYTSYAIARNWGWLNVNEIREKENENDIGPDGDIYLQPLNMVPAGEEVPTMPGKGGKNKDDKKTDPPGKGT